MIFCSKKIIWTADLSTVSKKRGLKSCIFMQLYNFNLIKNSLHFQKNIICLVLYSEFWPFTLYFKAKIKEWSSFSVWAAFSSKNFSCLSFKGNEFSKIEKLLRKWMIKNCTVKVIKFANVDFFCFLFLLLLCRLDLPFKIWNKL